MCSLHFHHENLNNLQDKKNHSDYMVSEKQSHKGTKCKEGTENKPHANPRKPQKQNQNPTHNHQPKFSERERERLYHRSIRKRSTTHIVPIPVKPHSSWRACLKGHNPFEYAQLFHTVRRKIEFWIEIEHALFPQINGGT